MRLPKPFYRLPLKCDPDRLRAEVATLPATAWVRHPNDIPGNSSVRLISVDGQENDDVNGAMRATPHLQGMPYVRQILASFGVVWSRSRLLRLAPGATVPEHADINYHWFNRVRLHIPIVTRSEVRFFCGDSSVHMAAGEVWMFDNWRLHRVENFTADERIHLVADTSGSAAFWRLAARGDGAEPVQEVAYAPGRDLMPLTERTQLAPVMSPAEVDLLVTDLLAELVAYDMSPEVQRNLQHFHSVLDAFCRDWRQLYALYGCSSEGWQEFVRLRDSVRAASRTLSRGLAMRTNHVDAFAVLEGRVLRPMLSQSPAVAAPAVRKPASAHKLVRPVFIVAAPRSGSTLLFETLAASSGMCSLGGEAHWLVEGIQALAPGQGHVDSNRLTESHATPEIAEDIVQQIFQRLQDEKGVSIDAPGSRRFLEKTPKNALRIPFFNQIFPDAQFIFLWRDPRENIASIIEAWRSGLWKTYNGLEGFSGPWSLLLPPGWREMNGKALEDIAAWQWERANRIALDDLHRLHSSRWTAVSYSQLVRDPSATIRRICGFLRLEVDDKLVQRLHAPLPLSLYTLTAPDAEKWRVHEAQIARVLPSLDSIWRELRGLPG